MKYAMLFAASALALSFAPAQAQDTGAAPDRAPQAAGKYFQAKDLDNDGRISKREFMAHQEKRFQELDQNGDGFIEPREAMAGKEHMREKIKEKREKMRDEGQHRRDDSMRGNSTSNTR